VRRKPDEHHDPHDLDPGIRDGAVEPGRHEAVRSGA